jgi:hypothetical protein
MISAQNRYPPIGRSPGGMLFRIMLYSQAHTSMTLAAQAASSATESVRFIRSQEMCSVVPMPAIFRRFYSVGPGDSFFPDSELVKDSKLLRKAAQNGPILPITCP